MNPFLQDVGRVCCQEVGSLFCHELEGKGVRKYESAHLQISASAAVFYYCTQGFFWWFRRDFWGGKKKGANPQNPSEITETETKQIRMSSLAVSVGYCGFVSSLIASCFSVLLLIFHFKGDYINGAFSSLHFVLHSAFNSL